MMGAEGDSTEALLDGRYRLGACVGEGGMARVYRGEDVVLGRTVAIKMIRPGVDGAASERARSEMTVLASLNHPSLVTLYDAHLVPGQPEYLVMEFVEGPTLGSRLDSGPLPPDVVAHLAAELAEALHVVHAAGIVHRDIKPSNVLFSPAALPGARARAKLADFGIALLLDGSRLTLPGLVIGTVAYLAPEQIRGGEPAPPADIYSLGLVLLEALTGERDHPHGAGMAAAMARLESPPVIPVSLGPGWSALLTGMLNLEPSQRPTAAEVAAAAGKLATGAAPGPWVAGAVDETPTAATVPVTAATLVAPAAGAGLGIAGAAVGEGVAAGDGVVAGAAAGAGIPAGSGAGVNAGAGAVGSARAGGAARGDAIPRRRRHLLAGIGAGVAAAVVVTATIIGVTSLSDSGQQPAPAATTPADLEPSEAPAPTDDGNEVVVDPGPTEEQLKEQEESRKKAEEEARKQDEEARKQEKEDRKRAEEEQKRLEEEQKKLEEEQQKLEEDAEDDQNGDD